MKSYDFWNIELRWHLSYDINLQVHWGCLDLLHCAGDLTLPGGDRPPELGKVSGILQKRCCWLHCAAGAHCAAVHLVCLSLLLETGGTEGGGCRQKPTGVGGTAEGDAAQRAAAERRSLGYPGGVKSGLARKRERTLSSSTQLLFFGIR